MYNSNIRTTRIPIDYTAPLQVKGAHLRGGVEEALPKCVKKVSDRRFIIIKVCIPTRALSRKRCRLTILIRNVFFLEISFYFHFNIYIPYTTFTPFNVIFMIDLDCLKTNQT